MNIDANPTYDKANDLCEIIERWGSDKGKVSSETESFHNYTRLYYHIFKGRRYNKLRIFELGIGTNNTKILCNMGIDGKPGASLRAWTEFFPDSRVFAADIDNEILFQTDRISTFYCDQTKADVIQAMWFNNVNLWTGFDIIIDDGLHRFDPNVTFFENSVHKLNVGGIFIIEDVGTSIMYKYKDAIVKWSEKYPNIEFRLISLKHPTNIWDNNLMLAKRLY